MRLGYNTNGFAHHRLEDTFEILAEIGYRSVALTLDHQILDPPDERGVGRAVGLIRPLMERTGLSVTIETGARFILDPRRKHQPTLISGSQDARERRLRFLKAAVDVAAGVEAESVSLWSGAADDGASEAVLWSRLCDGLRWLLEHAHARKVRLAFEPEPGMFIERMAQFERLHRELADPLFGLTLDIGHVHCLEDGALDEQIKRWRGCLWNVHIEDMRRGRHEHLMFGDGEIDFAATLASLRRAESNGPVHVELSRHSHDAVAAAQHAYSFLRSLVSVSHSRS